MNVLLKIDCICWVLLLDDLLYGLEWCLFLEDNDVFLIGDDKNVLH